MIAVDGPMPSPSRSKEVRTSSACGCSSARPPSSITATSEVERPRLQFNPCGNSRKFANLHKKKIFVPELNKSFTLTLSTKAIKTIQKKGAYATLKEAGVF